MRFLSSAVNRLIRRPQKNAQELLNDIEIAAPCPVSWESMVGDDRVRFCGSCELNVYNIAEMSADAATALIKEKQGEICLQLYRRNDGTVLTQDCPKGLKRLRQAFLKRAACVAGALGSLVSGTANAQSPDSLQPGIDKSAPSAQCRSRRLTGRVRATSVKPIIKATPVDKQPVDLPPSVEPQKIVSPPLMNNACEERRKFNSRMFLGLGALGLTLASFRFLRKRKTMWIMGVSLMAIFALLGIFW